MSTIEVTTHNTDIVVKDSAKVTASPNNYKIVGNDIYTVKRNSKPEQWFLDIVDDSINNSELATEVSDLSTLFGDFEDGVTREIIEIYDGQNKLISDVAAQKVSNDNFTAGILSLKNTKITADEASASARNTIAAWQNNGAGGAWFDEKIQVVSNVAYSSAKSASTLTATLTNQQKQLSNAFGAIDILQKQTDGKVMTWFGTDRPTIPAVGELPDSFGGVVDETVMPLWSWLAGNLSPNPDYEDTTEEDTRAEHTGDVYIYYELDANGNKNILATYRFTVDAVTGVYSWSVFKDDLASTAYQAALNAIGIADGKIATFLQDSPPHLTYTNISEEADIATYNKLVGDIWYDSDNKNKMFRYTRTPKEDVIPALYSYVWSPVTDKDLTASVTRLDEATVSVTKPNPLWIADDVNSDPDINGEPRYTASARAKSSLTVDANGSIAGFVAESDGSTSKFNIIADEFAVVSADGSGASPFKVNTVDQTIEFTGAVTFTGVKTEWLDNSSKTFTNDARANEAWGYADLVQKALDSTNKSLGTTAALAGETAKALGITNETAVSLGSTVDAQGRTILGQALQLDRLENQVLLETWYTKENPVLASNSSKPNPESEPYKSWYTKAIADGSSAELELHSGDTIVLYEVVDVLNSSGAIVGKENKYIDDYRFGTASGLDAEYTDEFGYGFFLINSSVADAANRQALASGITADAKINTFVTIDAPTDNDAPADSKGVKKLAEGDIWLKPPTNLTHRYTAGVWTELRLSTKAIYNEDAWTDDGKADAAWNYANSVDGDLKDLSDKVKVIEQQLDGVIETTFGTDKPTQVNGVVETSIPNASVEPYKSWLSADTANGNTLQRDIHSGDTYVLFEVIDGVDSFIADYRFGQLQTPDPTKTDADGYGFFLVSNAKADQAYQQALLSGVAADRKINFFPDWDDSLNPPTDIDAPANSLGVKALDDGDVYTAADSGLMYVYYKDTAEWKAKKIRTSVLNDDTGWYTEASFNTFKENEYDKYVTDNNAAVKKIDERIVNYFQDNKPYLASDGIKSNHGDNWFAPKTGELRIFRFEELGSGGISSWDVVTDPKATEAAEAAALAQASADGKITSFNPGWDSVAGTAKTPTAPYEAGDIWFKSELNADGNVIMGDVYVSTVDRASESSVYNAGDWVKAAKYTDDTLAKEASDAIDDLVTNTMPAIAERLSTIEKQTDGIVEVFTVSNDPVLSTLAGVTLLEPFSVPNNAMEPYKSWYDADTAGTPRVTTTRDKHIGDTLVRVDDSAYVGEWKFVKREGGYLSGATDIDGYMLVKVIDSTGAQAYQLAIDAGTLADGKINMIVDSKWTEDSKPNGTAVPSEKLGNGDIWIDQATKKTWVYSSSAGWLNNTLSSDTVVKEINKLGEGTTIDGAKITTGSITALQIEADSITADKIQVGGYGKNFVSDPLCNPELASAGDYEGLHNTGVDVSVASQSIGGPVSKNSIRIDSTTADGWVQLGKNEGNSAPANGNVIVSAYIYIYSGYGNPKSTSNCQVFFITNGANTSVTFDVPLGKWHRVYYTTTVGSTGKFAIRIDNDSYSYNGVTFMCVQGVMVESYANNGEPSAYQPFGYTDGTIISSNYKYNTNKTVTGFGMFAKGDPDSGSKYNIVGGKIYGASIVGANISAGTLDAGMITSGSLTSVVTADVSFATNTSYLGVGTTTYKLPTNSNSTGTANQVMISFTITASDYNTNDSTFTISLKKGGVVLDKIIRYTGINLSAGVLLTDRLMAVTSGTSEDFILEIKTTNARPSTVTGYASNIAFKK